MCAIKVAGNHVQMMRASKGSCGESIISLRLNTSPFTKGGTHMCVIKVVGKHVQIVRGEYQPCVLNSVPSFKRPDISLRLNTSPFTKGFLAQRCLRGGKHMCVIKVVGKHVQIVRGEYQPCVLNSVRLNTSPFTKGFLAQRCLRGQTHVCHQGGWKTCSNLAGLSDLGMLIDTARHQFEVEHITFYKGFPCTSMFKGATACVPSRWLCAFSFGAADVFGQSSNRKAPS